MWKYAHKHETYVNLHILHIFMGKYVLGVSYVEHLRIGTGKQIKRAYMNAYAYIPIRMCACAHIWVYVRMKILTHRVTLMGAYRHHVHNQQDA
jgi:hypothetical protein